MSKPEWKDAPVWAQWWAMDEDGDCFWYENEPTAGEFSWYHPGAELKGEWEDAGSAHDDICWKQTLERRP